MDNRRPRNVESRETAVRQRRYTPPSTLPTPNQQDGYKYRWVRTSMMGVADPSNVSTRFREGWEPVKMEDHPELKLSGVSGIPDGGNIEIGGLTLCKIPDEFVAQRSEYYSQVSQDQVKSVEQNYMRENDRRMPKFSERG